MIQGSDKLGFNGNNQLPLPAASMPRERPETPSEDFTTIQAVKRAEAAGEANVTVSEEQLVKAIEKAVKAVQGSYTYLEFSVHEQTKRIAVKVYDRETGEVIREVPPEKTLDFVAKLWEMAGIIIDEKR